MNKQTASPKSCHDTKSPLRADKLSALAACDLCGSEGPFKVLAEEKAANDPTLSYLGILETYRTVACSDCGWIFKPVEFSADQLQRLYDRHGGVATRQEDACDAIDQRARTLYEFINCHRDLASPIRVLDVGGGIGQVTRQFSLNGHDVHILDMSENFCEDSYYTYHQGTLESFQDSKSFDLIVMNHVLEHVWDPSRQLNFCRKLLRPGGLLYIEVPFELYTPVIKRHLGDPCHVGYFSRRTLRRFVEKTGLNPVACQRALGQYNNRRVMVLKCLSQNSEDGLLQSSSKSNQGQPPLALPLVCLEMFAPQQLYYMMRRTRINRAA